jgi:hypothetical protein
VTAFGGQGSGSGGATSGQVDIGSAGQNGQPPNSVNIVGLGAPGYNPIGFINANFGAGGNTGACDVTGFCTPGQNGQGGYVLLVW